MAYNKASSVEGLKFFEGIAFDLKWGYINSNDLLFVFERPQ